MLNPAQFPPGSHVNLEPINGSDKEFTGASVRLVDRGNMSAGVSEMFLRCIILLSGGGGDVAPGSIQYGNEIKPSSVHA